MKLYKSKIHPDWTVVSENKVKAMIELNRKFNKYKMSCTDLNSIEEIDTPFKIDKGIANVEDYNDYCQDLLTNWLQDLDADTHPQYCRKPDSDDAYRDHEPEFYYTRKGSSMVERAIGRLYDLGLKYFPDNEDDLDISTDMYREDF